MSHRNRSARALVTTTVALLTAASLAVASLAVSTAASAAVTGPGGPVTSSRAEARDALADARAALSGHAPVTGGPASRDVTMALLRLAQLRGSLTGADAVAANRVLARPAASKSACTAGNCYHWSTSGPDAVPSADSDADGTPDYVEIVMATVDDVRATYVGAGYRTPKTDGTVGGNAQTDVYLSDVGKQGYYGYCSSDEKIPNPPPSYDAWAFCVLDNDFSAAQFPTNTPLENLQVTAAHEYFHAVQFAYDAFEDSWLMEATATWAEDELYDDVDDNLQYLKNSPLSQPERPLDTFISGGGPQYGDWIFFRYLTEYPRLPTEEGGMPTLVRDIWERADGTAGRPNDYSMEAIENVLAARGVDWTGAFASFAAANRLPTRNYEEAAANAYPTAPPLATLRLTASRKDTGWKYARVDHLAAATVRFSPGTGLSASSWKLRLRFDLPDEETQTTAVVTVVRKNGAPTISRPVIDADGSGTAKVPFGSAAISYVEVTLINAGTSYACGNGGVYSCHGTSLDDQRKLLLRAQATK